MEQLDLQALVSFDAIAVHGGLGPAARATARPKATLSRHLAELERRLGVRLFARGDRRLRLTAEGIRLHERTHALLLDLADAARTVSDGSDRPRGALRVSAPTVFAHTALMMHAVGRLAAECPEVSLELVAEDRRVDPVEENYDLVIRIDPAPDERLVGRRIATDRRLLVGAPGLVPPAGTGEAAVPALLRSVDPPGTAWRIRTGDGNVRTLHPEARLRFSTLLTVREATLAGLGAALLPRLLVAPDLDAGILRCWGEADGPPVSIWALHPSRRLLPARVRAFLDILATPP